MKEIRLVSRRGVILLVGVATGAVAAAALVLTGMSRRS
jgi:hypothetical protein